MAGRITSIKLGLFKTLCGDSDIPVVVRGDFNEILHYGEKEGSSNKERRGMVGFREVVEECNLNDLRFVGPWYTWERGNS